MTAWTFLTGHKLRVAVGVGCFAAVVFAAGFWTAVRAIRLEIQVDYDSGAQRQSLFAGPFLVRRDPYGFNYLGLVRLANGRTGITGVPQWRVGLVFYGNSRRSQGYAAGSVLASVRQLETWFLSRQPDNMGEVKERFLRALGNGGEYRAHQVVTDFEKSMFSEAPKAERGRQQ